MANTRVSVLCPGCTASSGNLTFPFPCPFPCHPYPCRPYPCRPCRRPCHPCRHPCCPCYPYRPCRRPCRLPRRRRRRHPCPASGRACRTARARPSLCRRRPYPWPPRLAPAAGWAATRRASGCAARPLLMRAAAKREPRTPRRRRRLPRRMPPRAPAPRRPSHPPSVHGRRPCLPPRRPPRASASAPMTPPPPPPPPRRAHASGQAARCYPADA
eukprot:scaffold81114_cov59-Phaeocystis_antarctica.AAC.9